MGKVIYSMNVSLDGFVATLDGSLEWTVVDDELHTWFNEQARQADAFLYGRRMYELMAAYWPTAASDLAATGPMLDFVRIWVAKPKIVFSTTCRTVDWNSRLVVGDVAERLAELRSEFPGDLEVSGPTLASAFVERGLVDEYQLVVHPVVLGSGTPFFPNLEARIGLRLLETQTFESGVVYLGYSAVRDR
jgi:dihydrofolate reductase